jgi:hypothetical protein
VIENGLSVLSANVFWSVWPAQIMGNKKPEFNALYGSERFNSFPLHLGTVPAVFISGMVGVRPHPRYWSVGTRANTITN